MKRTIADYISATIAYMESPRGRIAWENNSLLLSMPDPANAFASIMTATGLRKYEALAAVYAGIGPELNARRCGKVA